MMKMKSLFKNSVKFLFECVSLSILELLNSSCFCDTYVCIYLLLTFVGVFVE